VSFPSFMKVSFVVSRGFQTIDSISFDDIYILVFIMVTNRPDFFYGLS
jgi:hypothetical protein